LHYKFCPQCGQLLTEKLQDGRDRMVCENCGFIYYQNPVPAAAVVVVQDEQVLLVKRKFAPHIGEWSLPAGFVEYNETPEEAAVRETTEETGITVRVKRLLDVSGTCDDHKSNIVLVVYEAEQIGGTLQAGDDAIEAGFYPLDLLPGKIAFSSHQQAINKYREK
jgi:8-oxo-dGTP diphosphatase